MKDKNYATKIFLKFGDSGYCKNMKKKAKRIDIL
jgi:hypothetical protein